MMVHQDGSRLACVPGPVDVHNVARETPTVWYQEMLRLLRRWNSLDPHTLPD